MFIPIPMQITGRQPRGTAPLANPIMVAVNVLAYLLVDPASWWVGPGTGPLSILTYAFVHAGFMHLLFNMWVLWVFGNRVNRRLGNRFYTFAYLGVAAAVGLIARMLSGPPLLGSSGAVFGVVAIALVLMPATRVELHYLALFPVTLLIGLFRQPKYPLFWFLRWGSFAVPALWCLALVPLMEFAGFVFSLPGWNWTHFAHLLGFAFGVGAVLLLPRRISTPQGFAYSNS